jgi:hypothetical protein
VIPYGPGVPLMVDTSAWVRQREPDVISRGLPAAGYLIAAAAAERGFGVLHLDAHYDTLASVLGFASVRLDRD